MNPLEDAACTGPDFDPEWWTGAWPGDHVKAAGICAGCPVREACERIAEAERTVKVSPRRTDVQLRPAGVWAGRLYDGTTDLPQPVAGPTPCRMCLQPFGPERANVAYCVDCRRIREQRPFRPAEHGSRSRFQSGCRCAECVGAEKDYHRQRYLARKRRAVA